MESCIQRFKEIYEREPDFVQFTPYRICPLGAHIDHQMGKVTGFAIDKGVYMAYGTKHNGVVELHSLQFSKRAQFAVTNIPEFKQGDWADHLRGATLSLSKRYPLRVGVCAVIDGELPIGGLSSSAAVIIDFLAILSRLNNISLNEKEMIEIAQEAENAYVGVSCGKLDQSCEVYCKRDNLLYLDIKTGIHKLIERSSKMKPFDILLIFSGYERSLADSKYNMRIDECKGAAYMLKALSGEEYGSFNDTFLRDVPYDVFEKYKDSLPISWQRRAKHFYNEMDRVEKGLLAWEKGDIDEFGKLVFESGLSSIELYETGSEELTTIYEILTKTKGVYGGRFSGAGFKGCCIAFVDPEYKEEIIKEVTERYCSKYPEIKDKFSICSCKTSDGVKL